MAYRILATRIWGPAANALRRHPGPVVPPPPPLAAAAHSRFVGTFGNQNDIGIRRRSIDVESIRDYVKRYKIEDEIMRENLRWASRFYKTMEWSSYVILSVSVACVTACELVVRSRRKDKGHVRPT